MLMTRPRATVLVTRAACAMFGSGVSAAYVAAPVTLRCPSTRETGVPIVMAASGLTFATAWSEIAFIAVCVARWIKPVMRDLSCQGHPMSQSRARVRAYVAQALL